MVTTYINTNDKPWKFCPGCGTQITAGGKFCAECGQQVGHCLAPYVIPMPPPWYPYGPYWGTPIVTTTGTVTTTGGEPQYTLMP
jgi:predicted amidophosphoribosyltransferase